MLKKTVLVAILALVSSWAQAAATDWLTHDAVEVGAGFSTPGSFEDTFAFSISQQVVLNTSVTVANNNPPPISISDGKYQLFSNPDTIIGTDDDVLVSGAFTFDGTTGSTPHSIAISSGNYYFMVYGIADGTTGGLYTLTSQIVPIPEPEIYAMLAAGLGFMGFVARRRKQQLAA